MKEAPASGDLDRLWETLASTNPRHALAAVRSLAAVPNATLALLAERLQPAPPDEPAATGLTPEVLRGIRAVELLTQIATPAAKELLAKMAGGAPDSAVTDAAASALSRLSSRG